LIEGGVEADREQQTKQEQWQELSRNECDRSQVRLAGTKRRNDAGNTRGQCRQAVDQRDWRQHSE
jgi:hypothetical protein